MRRQQHQQYKEIVSILSEASDILQCGLDSRCIEILLELIHDGGLSAEALATIILGIREEFLKAPMARNNEQYQRV